MRRTLFLFCLIMLTSQAAWAITEQNFKAVLDTCALKIEKPLIFYHWGPKKRVESLLKGTQSGKLDESLYNEIMKSGKRPDGTAVHAGPGIYVANNFCSSSAFGSVAAEIEIKPGNYILQLSGELSNPEVRRKEPERTVFNKLVEIGKKEGRLKPQPNGEIDESQLREVLPELVDEILRFPYDYKKDKRKFVISFSKGTDTLPSAFPASKTVTHSGYQSDSHSDLSDSDGFSDSESESESQFTIDPEDEIPYEWLVVKTPDIIARHPTRDTNGNPLDEEELEKQRSLVDEDGADEEPGARKFFDRLISEVKHRATCPEQIVLPSLTPAGQLASLTKQVKVTLTKLGTLKKKKVLSGPTETGKLTRSPATSKTRDLSTPKLRPLASKPSTPDSKKSDSDSSSGAPPKKREQLVLPKIQMGF